MDTWSYKARKRDGTLVSGSVAAPNEAAVASYISKQNMYVAEIKPAAGSTVNRTNYFQKKATIYDVAIFARQFATLLGAGVPILNGLQILTEQTVNKQLGDALTKVTMAVREGRSLSSAFGDFPAIFPELMTNMTAAGETGGILETVMDRLAVQYEKDYRMTAKFRSAMVYPAIVLSVAGLVVAIVMMFVMPVFVELFKSAGLQLPAVTRAVIAISNFVRDFWWLIILGFIGLYFVFKQADKKREFRLWRDRLLLKLPIFGDLYNKIIVSRFARTFASLSRSGVPILTAMTIVSKATGSLAAESVMNDARSSLRRGNTLADPMEASGLFPPIVIGLVRIGEESGSLDTMLDKAADFYEAEVDDTINRLQTIMDPILIVILGIIIGTLAVALLLPMFDIVSKMGNM